MTVLITGGSGFIGRHLARAHAPRQAAEVNIPIGKIGGELGYRPEVTLAQGLQRTREWMVRGRREAP
jgi:nucleoside-diphosphate-sugar epimerase